ncbi:sugar porter family MFS transporter [Rubrobacter aplysinae]|uniref:sugar porter family MFS transporter n=1 Tax=Rubrobacter aplysinae TaxID=909625 RepID=UPI00064BE633|nr:sugar porter family MFS transporter [Rubrobacter aplysinae]
MAQPSSSAGGTGDTGGNRRFVYVIASVAALGGLLFGYDTGVISGALLFINQDFQLNAFLEGFIVSSLLLGAMVGAGVSGALSDRLGRRTIILVAAIIFGVGAVGAGLAPTIWVLIVFRFMLGLGVGAASALVPSYISESAPTDVRGSLSSLFQLAITLGILLAYLINGVFATADSWRWPLGLALIPAVVLFVGMYFLPETPRWLVSKNREEEARRVLSHSRSSEEVEREIGEIRAVEQEEEDQVGYRELFAPWVRPMIVVGVGLAVFQQLVGINTVIYYAPTIIQSTGLENVASVLSTIGIGVVNVLMTVVAILIVDRVGRKPLLLVGLAGMVVSLLVIGGAFLLPGLSGIISWVTLVGLMLYVASFAVSFGPLLWVMLPEIFPVRARGAGTGLSSLSNWGANFVVAQAFLPLVAITGRTTVFWGLGVICVLAGLFIYFVVPETRGRSLEDIESDLREGATTG